MRAASLAAAVEPMTLAPAPLATAACAAAFALSYSFCASTNEENISIHVSVFDCKDVSVAPAAIVAGEEGPEEVSDVL